MLLKTNLEDLLRIHYGPGNPTFRNLDFFNDAIRPVEQQDPELFIRPVAHGTPEYLICIPAAGNLFTGKHVRFIPAAAQFKRCQDGNGPCLADTPDGNQVTDAHFRQLCKVELCMH